MADAPVLTYLINHTCFIVMFIGLRRFVLKLKEVWQVASVASHYVNKVACVA